MVLRISAGVLRVFRRKRRIFACSPAAHEVISENKLLIRELNLYGVFLGVAFGDFSARDVNDGSKNQGGACRRGLFLRRNRRPTRGWLRPVALSKAFRPAGTTHFSITSPVGSSGRAYNWPLALHKSFFSMDAMRPRPRFRGRHSAPDWTARCTTRRPAWCDCG